MTKNLRVWDAAVRFFHWTLVILVATSVTTGLTGGNAMAWHERSGVLILALVLFRWAWGLVGSSTARFSGFLRGPSRVLAFASSILRRSPAHVAGHNPLGGWMVLLLLLSLTLQAVTGLFADDEILTSGPLARLVSNDTNSLFTAIHGSNAWVLVTLVAIHVAAVLFHFFVLRENLVRPMFTGRKPWPDEIPRPELRFPAAWLAPLLLVGALAIVYGTLAYLGN